METQKTCPCCGASMKMYWHKLTPVLVDTLVKVHRQVRKQDENVIKKKDLDLTHSQYGNFQKLRFHALIAKHKVDGIWTGDWVLTKRGGEFLRNAVAVPAKVQTFRNKVVDHDEQLVTIEQILGREPYLQVRGEFEFDLAGPDQVQRTLGL